jgi:hypothetical protein
MTEEKKTIMNQTIGTYKGFNITADVTYDLSKADPAIDYTPMMRGDLDIIERCEDMYQKVLQTPGLSTEEVRMLVKAKIEELEAIKPKKRKTVIVKAKRIKRI